MILTSGYNFEGYKITKYFGFCSGECALGTGFLSSDNASVADFLGSNSSMYAGKLSRAKSIAISDLQNKAESLGANAIIGLDVDYTTFSSDIIGVAANGTAVIIEKIVCNKKQSIKLSNVVTENQNDDIAEFPIINYYPELKVRPFNLLLDLNTKEIQILLYGFEETRISAMNADIIANTIFGTAYEYPDINFIDCIFDAGVIKTEKIPFNIPVNQLKVVQSISVRIKHYICDGKVYSLGTEYQVSDMPIKQLLEFRKKYGKDVVSDFHDCANGWTCMCGSNNKENDNVCAFCGRSKNVHSKIICSTAVQISKLLPELSKLHNSREVYSYLINMNYELPKEIMEELKELSGIERIYGSMINSAISKLKKYISENE